MKPLSVDAEQSNAAMVHRLLTPSRGQDAVLTTIEGKALRCFVEDYTAARADWGRATEYRDRVIDVQTVLSLTTYCFLTMAFDEGHMLETAEKECGIPARSGKVILKIAAEQLVLYYELV